MGIVRFALALSVAFWHLRGAPFYLLNAQVAVTLFFIISGFYMAMVINEKYAPAGGSWIKNFYLARFWRLYPPYLAMVMVMLAWGSQAGMTNPLITRLPMSVFEQVIVAIPNVFLFGQDWHQFLVRIHVDSAGPQALLDVLNRINPAILQDNIMAVGHAWSLASEATFYLIAPLFVRSTRKTLVALTIALGMRFYFIEIMNQKSYLWGYFFFPGNACMFIMGSAAYHLHRLIPRRDIHSLVGWLGIGAFVVWMTLTTAEYGIVMPYGPTTSIDEPRFWALYISFAVLIPFMFEATKKISIDREIGELSYPLYLVHGLVLGFIYFRWNGPQGVVPDAWAAVIFCIFAAYAMRGLVELPIERWRSKRLSVSPTTTAFLSKPAPAAVFTTHLDSRAVNPSVTN